MSALPCRALPAVLATAGLLVTGMTTVTAALAQSAPATEPVIRTVGAISYVCGGVGADEQQALAGRKLQFNLELLFTQGSQGEYLSDVDVKLTRDGHEVARFSAEGPRCLIKAPQGSYNVHATYNGQPKSMTVTTGSRNNQLRW